jgi:hypothetical protein
VYGLDGKAGTRREAFYNDLKPGTEESCAGQEMRDRADMCELSELCELSLLLH